MNTFINLKQNIIILGKTNCVLRFVNGQYRENYIPTVEDTYRQVVSCNKQITTLQITDTYDSEKNEKNYETHVSIENLL